MEIQTRLDIHRAIEYIKQDAEFPFDTHDDVYDILDHYGIELRLSVEEAEVLWRELAKLTGQRQTQEIAHTVMDREDQVREG